MKRDIDSKYDIAVDGCFTISDDPHYRRVGWINTGIKIEDIDPAMVVAGRAVEVTIFPTPWLGITAVAIDQCMIGKS